jgi:hypothetical protein
MKFHGEDQSFLCDVLLRISAAGIFAYSAFNIVAGGLGLHSDLRNILVMAVGGITIVQVRIACIYFYEACTYLHEVQHVREV